MKLLTNSYRLASLFALLAFSTELLGANCYYSRGTGIEGDDSSPNWSNSLRWSRTAPTSPDYYNPDPAGAIPTEADTIVLTPNSGFSGSDTSSMSPIILDVDVTVSSMSGPIIPGENMVSGIKAESNQVLTFMDTAASPTAGDYGVIAFNTDKAAMAGYSFTLDTDIIVYTNRTEDNLTGLKGCKGMTMNFADNRVIEVRTLSEGADRSLNIKFSQSYINPAIKNEKAIFNVNSQIIASGLRLGAWNQSTTYHHLGVFYVGGSQTNYANLYAYGAVTVHLQKEDGALVVSEGNEVRLANSTYAYFHGNHQIGTENNLYFGGGGGCNYEGISDLSAIVYMQGYNVSGKTLGASTTGTIGIIDFAGDDPDMRVLGAGEKTTLAFLGVNMEEGSQIVLRNFDESTCQFLLGVDVDIDDYKIGYYDENDEIQYTWFKSEDIVSFEGNDYYSYTTVLVPEASFVAALFGIFALGFAVSRRRR